MPRTRVKRQSRPVVVHCDTQSKGRSRDGFELPPLRLQVESRDYRRRTHVATQHQLGSSRELHSLRHTFAWLGRVAGESAFNVARMMGHSRSTLVDQVYAHSLRSGMASVAERVTARALGEQPKLRVIEGKQQDIRQT